jgi:integrase-like protein
MTATRRPANSRSPSRLTEDSPLGAVIDAYLAGNAADGDQRELRSALSHVAAELGTMPVRTIRARHVAALLDDLSDAGLSTRREAAVLDALHAVFAFAVARGLTDHDPTPGRRRRPRAASSVSSLPSSSSPPPRQNAARAPTPTLTMLALGARVALWTTWIIVVGFLVLLVVLLFEFG